MRAAERWRGRTRFTVFYGDHGDGDGAALRTRLDAWRADPDKPPHLHLIALSPDLMPGVHRIPQPDAGVTLDLVSSTLDAALAQLAARVDLFVLDGLAQAGEAFARPLARVAAQDAVIDARGLTPAQVGALTAQGFVFDDAGRGSTQSARFASRKPRPPSPPEPERRAIVLGAGIAGCAAAERLCARGWDVTLVERHAQPAGEASGNRAGIFMPLVSKDDNIPTRLTRSAYLFALRHWAALGGLQGGDALSDGLSDDLSGGPIEGQACGVLQLARDAEHAAVQRAIGAAGTLPREFAEWLERPQAEALLGLPAPDGGWLFRQGGWARPGSVCAAMLAACGAKLTQRLGVGDVHIEAVAEGWRVLDALGTEIARAPTLILANGVGALRIPQASALPLTAMRGQVTHVPAGLLPPLPLVLCREAYLTPVAHGVCSAGATYDLDPDPALWPSSQQENLERLRGLLSEPHAFENLPLQGRVGFRCIAPDRLPLVGRLPDVDALGGTERLRDVPRHPGLHTLLGYASRGLIWAGWAAELLAAQLEGEPLPLESTLVDALDPARFVLRARRNPRAPQGS
ncbi:FAD-dependent 5-carboxymethylaminomethyl-2-thiouridine(34) oxidoreductase MnmC [Massilia sp. 9096]|uniref:FAD-dependent 5-carboxymethylaminomethyl-2-thiouridine(34) oxidoreductase MnmC n=1 Tax=Massilia sp. 9096 TaxID=1500894 RepID=UPI0005611C00|nr:FAD-dependent 5-carboxymethylaminomethyl-2-thiouridine(34) oxidoreductase MnmC [Massilia sp. 9096]